MEKYIIRFETDDKVKGEVEEKTLSIAHKDTKGYDYFVKVYGGAKDCYKMKDIMRRHGYKDVMGTYDTDNEIYKFGFTKEWTKWWNLF